MWWVMQFVFSYVSCSGEECGWFFPGIYSMQLDVVEKNEEK